MAWMKFGRACAQEPTARERAQQLRVRYGQNAEQWCDLGIMAERDPRQRRSLEAVREALIEVQTW